MLGGHVRAVFTLVTIIFIVCVIVTLNSFREIPLWKLETITQNNLPSSEEDMKAALNEQSLLKDNCQLPDPINKTASYGALSKQCEDGNESVNNVEN